jgi:iron complex outermembrane receptor protein
MKRNARLTTKLLVVAMGAALYGGAAQAQDTQSSAAAPTGSDKPADVQELDAITVTGIRASLENSLNTKRDAVNQVDSISAEEAGKFPDNNLAESLQRVPGITVTRGQFNGSGQQISVRGLGPDFTNVLLNSRSMPSDTGQWCGDYCGNSRAFNFDVLPSEMISRVDVNKTMMPGLTEGGIGATVNVFTQRPLDIGRTFSTVSIAGNRVENNDDLTPSVAGIISVVNPAKTFGVTMSGSYTDLRTSRDYYRVEQWENQGTRQNQEFFAPDGTSLGYPTVGRQEAFGHISGGSRRAFGSVALQFKPSDDLTLTFDGFYSQLKQVQQDSIVDANFGNVIQNPTFGPDGVLTSGFFPGPSYGPHPEGYREPSLYTVIRERNRTAENYALGFNALWHATDGLDIVADVSYAKSTGVKPFDPYFRIGRPPQDGVTWSLTGNDPVVGFNDPVFSDPSLVRVGYTGNWGQTIEDDIYEASLTGIWKPEEGVLQSITAGLNYQDHSKNLLDYYGNNNNPYDGAPNGSYYLPVDPGLLRPASFGSNFLDGAGSPPVNGYLTYDPRAMMDWLCASAQAAQATKPQDPAYGCYYNLKLGGTFGITEKVLAAYIDTHWSGDNWSGNAGVRVVHVQNASVTDQETVTGFAVVGADNHYEFTRGPKALHSQDASYWSILPSANFTYRFTDNLQLRLGASRSLTRMDIGALRWYEDWGGEQGNLRLSRGNPGLKPQYSNNFDASLEWYASNLSYLAAAGFYKDISNFAGSRTITGVNVPGAPEPVTVTEPVNVAEGKVQGYEIAAQYNLGDTFPALDGFGFNANFTHVKTTRSDASSCGVNGVSPDSYNVGAFYDNGRIMLRAAYNWRSKYLQTCNWDGSGANQYHAAYGQADVSVRFNVNSQLQLFADAVNLTNEDNYLYFGNNRPIQRSIDYRRFDIGLRYRF